MSHEITVGPQSQQISIEPNYTEVQVSSNGARGAAGLGWTSGNGAPVSNPPNGSFYLDDLTSDYYKRVGGVWVLQGNLQGEAGSDFNRILFLADHGVFEEYPTSYREVIGGLFPTDICWYTDNTKVARIYRREVTWTGINVTQEVRTIYENDGVTIKAQATDLITYSGVQEISRTRSVV